MKKTCEYCGSEFEAARNARYCSEKCKALGARHRYNEWKERTNHNAKRREQRRVIADQEAATAKDGVIGDKLKQRAHDNAARASEAFEERCKKGDVLALMVKEAEKGRQSWDYWHHYKQYHINYANQSGRPCTQEVNNISVEKDGFEDLVLMSIQELNVIITRG